MPGREDSMEKGQTTHSSILGLPLQLIEKSVCRSGSNSQNWTWNNRLVPNQERSTSGLCIVTLLIELSCRVYHAKCRLDEAQAGIRIAGRNINNLRYADDTTLMAESEEELKSFLKKVKEESEKVGLKLNIQKLRSWHLVPSLHGKQMGKQWKQ